MPQAWGNWLRRRAVASLLGTLFLWGFPIAFIGDCVYFVCRCAGASVQGAQRASTRAVTLAGVIFSLSAAVAAIRAAADLPPPPSLVTERTVTITLRYDILSCLAVGMDAIALATAATLVLLHSALSVALNRWSWAPRVISFTVMAGLLAYQVEDVR